MRLIFHVMKIGRSARAGKAAAVENGLKRVGKRTKHAQARQLQRKLNHARSARAVKATATELIAFELMS